MLGVRFSLPQDRSVRNGTPGHLIAVVISHADAPITAWQSLVLDDDAMQSLLARARTLPTIRGIAIVATCSRTDVYAEVDDAHEGVDGVRTLLQDVHGAPPSVMALTRVLHGPQVAAHLFRVAAGLESIALGEHEIQGQIRHALQRASELHLTGTLVHRLLERALATGGRARHETQIGHGATTLGHAAAMAVAEACAPTPHSLVVVVGAGHMAEQAVRHLRARGVERLVIVNRSIDAARRLARQVDALALPWAALPVIVAEASAVVAAVRTNHAVIDRAMLERARADVDSTLCLVDLGSPPNVDPACATLPGVVRCDLDALHRRLQGSYDARRAEIDAAQHIVDDEVARFQAWCEHRRLAPAVRRLHECFRAEADVVIAREAHRLGGDREQLQRFADALVRRLLHRPMIHLQSLAREASDDALAAHSTERARPALDAAASPERVVIDAYVAPSSTP